MGDSTPPEQLRAADDYDANRQPARRSMRWLHEAATGPLFEARRTVERATDDDINARG